MDTLKVISKLECAFKNITKNEAHKEMENIKESLINMEDRVRPNVGLYVVFETDYRGTEAIQRSKG